MEFISKFRKEHGGSPTYREITDHFGFKSPKASADHVRALEKKGLLRRKRKRARGIELIFNENISSDSVISIPILGSIPAGFPEEHIERWERILSVDKTLIGVSRNNQLFAVRVSGNSMEGRGIFEGDWAIADADSSPQEGDIVVALIDGENTLKILAREKGRFFLKAANPNYPDLFPTQKMMIQGVVRTVIRRMG